LRSTPRKNESETPFFDQPSLSSNAGRPNFPAGNATVNGCGDEPAVMSTSNPVSSWIRSATESIRAIERESAPVTPATRTRIDEIGARCSVAGTPCQYWPFRNAGRLAIVVRRSGGCWMKSPRFCVGESGLPCSA